MDLGNILGALTGNDAASAISQNLNIDTTQVSSVITAALPSLLGAMQKNASTEAGAASLSAALGQHAGNAGNIISSLKSGDLTDGGKILSHIFGGNLGNVLGGISKQTGVASNSVKSILASIAPSLLALLGKGQQGSGISAAGLPGMLDAGCHLGWRSATRWRPRQHPWRSHERPGRRWQARHFGRLGKPVREVNPI